MQKALIFSCAMGGGHRAAAKALEEQLNIETVQIDLYSLLFPSFHESMRKSYSAFHQKRNQAFRIYQKLNQRKEEILALITKLEPLFLPVIDELIRREKPDLLLSTFSMSSLCLASYKRRVDNSYPLITAITDLSPHLFWVHKETDLYLVAADSTKRELQGLGVNPQKILLSGIPTSPRFKPGQKEDLVLVSGGGLGLLPEDLTFYEELIKSFKHVKILCGNNTKLYKKLGASKLPLELAEFLPDLSHDYARAKLLITKPGGMTTFEALHSRTPLLLFPAHLEQEKSNEAFICSQKMGARLDRNLSHHLENLDVSLSHYEKNIESFRKSLDPLAYEKVLCYLS